MKIALATILLALLAIVVYGVFFWQHNDQYDWLEIEEIVKPKIQKIETFIGTLKKEAKALGEEDQKELAADDLIEKDAQAAVENEILYPVPEEQDLSNFTDKKKVAALKKPLPQLNSSDKPIKEVVEQILSNKYFGETLRLEAVILRFVVTVDNLTKAKLPSKYRLVRPASGKFRVTENKATGSYSIDAENNERYASFMLRLIGINVESLLAVYIYYYPLIQEAYDSLGYSNRYFNDRFVEVIDHLLKTPKVSYPIEVLRTTIGYKFADPNLQSLSAGQKIMLRVGSDNQTILRKTLAMLRASLVKMVPDKKI
ncbi:MAG: DUF3014 domain-containing protein [Thiohalomonadales bacterium]